MKQTPRVSTKQTLWVLAAGVGFVGGVFGVSPAAASELDRFYMSSGAALQAGAITADSADGGSIWYNPAGLARIDGFRFDVNVSAYALRLGGAVDLDAAGSDGSKAQLSVLDFAPVPAALSFTKRFKNFTAGFGVFVPQMSVTGVRTHVSQPATEEHPSIDLSIDLHETRQSLFAGPSFGLNLGSRVALGMSLFLNYRSLLSTGDFSIAATEGDQTAVSTYHELVDWLELGVAASLGVQIDVSDRVRLGMNMLMPSLRIFQILDRSETSTEAVPGDVQHSVNYGETLNFPPRFLSPPRFNTGLSYQWPHSRLAFELGYQAPFRNDETDEDFRPVFNGRIGYSHALSNKRNIGGGFFTNMSSNRAPESLGDRQVNYFGITIATQAGTPYEVSRRDGQELNPKGKLIFGSGLAFSYAIGIGKVVHGQVGFQDGSDVPFEEVTHHVVAHEWILSLGSSLLE